MRPMTMIDDRELGHRETCTDLPRPTERVAAFGFAGWGLPAVSLSWGSMAIGVLVLGALQSTESLRLLFRLPVSPEWVSLAAALVAWGIAFACRSRPGRRLPRIWSLALAVAASLLAVGALFDPDPRGTPWVHALSVACLAGALVLAPRLLVVRPDRQWAQQVVPVSLVGALIVILVPALWVGRWGYRHEARWVEGTVDRVASWADEIEGAAALGWSELDRSAPELDRRLTALDGVDPEELARLVREPRIWRSAAHLGLDRALEEALVELGRTVAGAFEPEHAPRLSVLEEALVRWDPRLDEWVVDRELVRIAEQVGRYHRRLGQVFWALDPGPSEDGSPVPDSLRAAFGDRQEEVAAHLASAHGRWGDHWVVARVAHAQKLVERVELPLEASLGLPFRPVGSEEPAPADLWRLMSLHPDDAVELATGAPGCRSGRYVEAQRQYLRIDCQDHAADPREGRDGATLRTELRIVYTAPAREELSPRALPAEVYLLFPVPLDRSAGEYRETVAHAVARAVIARWTDETRFIDRGGSPLHGFVLGRDDRELVVYRSTLEPFVDDRQAVVVRAEWR